MPELQRQAVRLHYDLHGTCGEPVLLIQGVGVIGNGWRPQVDSLAATHRLLTFDNRGLGLSALANREPLTIEAMMEDARALLDAAEWTSAHVVGHSMGGVIAQRLALSHPHRVKSLALLCTVACGADAVRMTPRMIWISLRTHLGTRALRRRAFLELICPPESLADRDCALLATEFAPLFGHDLAEQPQIALRQALALRRHDCTGELSRLASIPTLVLSARHDPIAPPQHGRKLATLISGARFVEITSASHGVPITHATEVNRHLAEHIASATLQARPAT
jgi:aminoacrylate hydrolase